MIGTRAEVVAEALSWLHTPYQHAQMVKGAGVDCGMIAVAVYGACGAIPEGFRPAPYPPDWHLHRGEERYLAYVRAFGREIDRADVLPGDFGVWKFGRTFSHGAIFITPEIVIHAVRHDGQVIMSDATRDADLISTPALFFTPWGIERDGGQKYNDAKRAD